MDLYLFYNCFNNLKEIHETPENRLTLRHQYLFNNPLLLSEYFDKAKFKPIILDNRSPTYFHSGGKNKKKEGEGAASEGAASEGAAGEGDAKKEGAAGEGDAKKEGAAGEGEGEGAGEPEATEEDVKETLDTEAEDELENFKKVIKKFMKIIIGIIMAICIPIVPWILITFYAFKNMGEFLDINMNRL